MGGPQSRSGRGGEEKNSLLCFYRASNPGGLAHSLVLTLTELPRLTEKKKDT